MPSIHDSTRLCSMRCAGVLWASAARRGVSCPCSSSRAASTVTAPSLGCIKLLATVMATMTTSTMTMLCGSRMVWLTGTGAVNAPLVAAARASPGVAMVSGMEPDRPACHTTKPL